jgi:hypothetical protein
MEEMLNPNYSDPAKRCSDIVTGAALIANAVGDYGWRWVAIRLSDGGSDGEVYETRQDAIDHQLHETLCALRLVPPIWNAAWGSRDIHGI